MQTADRVEAANGAGHWRADRERAGTASANVAAVRASMRSGRTRVQLPQIQRPAISSAQLCDDLMHQHMQRPLTSLVGVTICASS